jgi:hypothetical protein
MNRTFVIFSVTELDSIDFSQVLETSAETVRKSVDGLSTFVKWDGEDVPSCVLGLTTKGDYLTYEEILAVLSGPDWTQPMEP